MPARISLSDDAILEALEESGGHIAAAASLLKISTKTLRRRLMANPSLRLDRPVHPTWQEALNGNVAIRDGTDPSMPGGSPFSRYTNRLQTVGGWDDDETEYEPRVLDHDEMGEFISSLASKKDSIYRVNPAETLRHYRPRDPYKED